LRGKKALLKHKIHRSARLITNNLTNIMSLLLRDEATSSKFLLIAAAAALIIANTPWHAAFNDFWQQHFYIGIGNFGLSETLKHWIDEGLMAIFFLIIGLEIKREIIRGELNSLRAASLPIAAAAGGIAFAIGIYLFANNGHAGVHGWGIPMTTDTALALSVLAFMSTRVPVTLKIFLMAVMVVDDLAAILAITLFYNHHIHLMPLFVALAVVLAMIGLQWIRFMHFYSFVGLGILLWICIHAAGVHASIAGAIMGLCAPIVPRSRKLTSRAIAERLERSLIPITTFVIIPLFALTNTGVDLRHFSFAEADAARIGLGIAGGLLVGKSLGIITGAWIVVRLKIADLPEGLRWGHIVGSALLAGIGFTLSIFISDLAFHRTDQINAAKVAIFVSSIIAASLGLFVLRHVSIRHGMETDPDHF
jgi:NhaA family Na+:H+ antiporter